MAGSSNLQWQEPGRCTAAEARPTIPRDELAGAKEGSDFKTQGKRPERDLEGWFGGQDGMTLSPTFWGLRLLKIRFREYCFIIREIKAITTLNLTTRQLCG